MTNINELNLNDSVINAIELRQGQVELKLDYIDDYVTQQSSRKSLIFLDCSKFVFEMRYCYDLFGAILSGEQKILNDYIEYKIVTSTTASTMIIHARKFELVATQF